MATVTTATVNRFTVCVSLATIVLQVRMLAALAGLSVACESEDYPAATAEQLLPDAAVQMVPAQPDAGVPTKCAIILCGVAHPELCEGRYGDTVYGGETAKLGEPWWCSTSDLGAYWLTCCLVECAAGACDTQVDSSCEYHCGRTYK